MLLFDRDQFLIVIVLLPHIPLKRVLLGLLVYLRSPNLFVCSIQSSRRSPWTTSMRNMQDHAPKLSSSTWTSLGCTSTPRRRRCRRLLSTPPSHPRCFFLPSYRCSALTQFLDTHIMSVFTVVQYLALAQLLLLFDIVSKVPWCEVALAYLLVELQYQCRRCCFTQLNFLRRHQGPCSAQDASLPPAPMPSSITNSMQGEEQPGGFFFC